MSDLTVYLYDQGLTAQLVDDELRVALVAAQGPAGPPGPSGGVYEHVQAVASDVWTIAHNLNVLCPSVTVADSSTPPRQLLTHVRWPDRNTAVVELAGATSGFATVG